MLKLKLQSCGHLMQRTDSFEKTLILGKIEGGRRKGWQRMRWLDGITDLVDMVWVNSRSWWWTGRPGVLQSMGSQIVGHDWVTELNWTEQKTMWTIGKPGQQMKRAFFHGGKEEVGGFVLNKSSLEEKIGGKVMTASHWLQMRTVCCYSWERKSSFFLLS